MGFFNWDPVVSPPSLMKSKFLGHTPLGEPDLGDEAWSW